MPIKVMPNNKEVVMMSFSAWKTYKTCPQWYYREKVLRESTEEADLSYNVPGLIVHHATEYYLKNNGDDRIFNPTLLEGAVEKHSTDPQVDLVKAYGSIEKVKDFTKTCGENLYRFLLTRDIIHKKYLSEAWFGTWDEPLFLSPNLATQGAPDLIEINENNTAILYDYKATWSTKNLDKEQLLLYKIAAKQKWGINVSMCAFFLLPKNYQDYFRFTEQQEDNLLREMQQAANDILTLRENLPHTPSEKCERCPFQSSCTHSKEYTPEKYKAPDLETTPTFQAFGSVEL